MHIVLSLPNGEPVNGLAVCGAPVASFVGYPSRPDRICQKCVLIDLGLYDEVEP